MTPYRDAVELTSVMVTPEDLGASEDGSYANMTPEHVVHRLRQALRALEKWRDADMEEGDHDRDPPALPGGAARDIAAAYGLLDRVNHMMPHVMGWGVGYFWADGEAWSCFTAHASVKDAERFRNAWESKAGDARDNWVVRWCPCEITDFVKPGASATRYVAESQAFS